MIMATGLWSATAAGTSAASRGAASRGAVLMAASLWSAAAACTSATTAAATAAAAALDIRVGYHETAALETINIVNVGSLNQRRAVGIDQHIHTTSVNHRVFLIGCVFQPKDVLRTAVSAGSQCDSQKCFRGALLFQNLLQLLRCGLGNCEEGGTFSGHS